MNRAQRRTLAHMNKAEKEELNYFNNILNNLNNKLNEVTSLIEQFKQNIETPCLYLKNQPIYEGAVIFLKKDNSINYTNQLRYLIESNHRFVIITKPLKKTINTVLICLLSTSEIYNKDLEQGIKLNGNYNESKNVYMDVTKSWIIPIECIEKLSYNLIEEDMDVCSYKFVNGYFEKTKLIAGVLENHFIKDDYNYYLKIVNKELKEEFRNYYDYQILNNFIKKLSSDCVKDIVDNKISKNIYNEIVWRIKRKVYRNESDIDLNNEDILNRNILVNFYMGDSTIRSQLIKDIIRNY